MRYRVVFLASIAAAACNPDKADPGADESSSTVVSGSETSAQGTSEAPTSSGSDGSDGSTGAVDPCNWDRSEFCPAPSGVGTTITGTSPFGPVNLSYALFGQFYCGCPTPLAPGLGFYSEPPGADVREPPGDSIQLFGAHLNWDGPVFRIDGVKIATPDVERSIELIVVPSYEQLSSPLDESNPPILTGTVSIQGAGWDVSGEFAASLCTALDWSIPCE